MSDDSELGLETLLAVKAELGVDLDDELLEACFEIQKKYQFNHDRTLSTQAMDRLIEDRVEKAGGKQTEDEA
ncbi:DNA modification system-associated small protein [Minwuia sp. IMCC3077]|uniref:DNA modification system-associated small protein n=1 Tax=Minwuia sp. IMCC3077 TaxID=3040676 RepID=UPI002479D92F|nr:DNA modification system-associated small protein [Minwuia sp. IMCC3077]